MANEYTKSWQTTFLREESPQGVRRELTAHQVQFLRYQLPLPGFLRILDVCCGLGRHARPLATAGYQVVGIDRDSGLVAEAQSACPEAEFIALDMRDLDHLDREFDAAICMWQSFGYFDEATNLSVLRAIAGRVRSGGRIVLDLYNRRYFKAVDSRRSGQHWTADRWDYSDSHVYADGRLQARIEWASGEGDEFDWQLYSPDELQEMGKSLELTTLLTCADFKPQQVAGNRRRSFQIVFEKS